MSEIDDLRERNRQLELVCDIARNTISCVEEWWGHVSTAQAAKDSMWRLSRALRSVGYAYEVPSNINWRGSIFNELNEAGFHASRTNPYESDDPVFVYDPVAVANNRAYGNAVGPTIKQIVAEWKSLKDADENLWISLGEDLPTEEDIVFVRWTVDGRKSVGYWYEEDDGTKQWECWHPGDSEFSMCPMPLEWKELSDGKGV